MKFIDEVSISVQSGSGGPGCVSFLREKYVPRGGPDGGDGGHGGRVIFKTNTRLNSLLDLRPQKKYVAKNGEPGQAQNKSGKDGSDLVLEIPPGTLIKDENGQVFYDLQNEQEIIFLKGGRGGKGNSFFKNSVNQAPTHAQPGEKGEEYKLNLELKLIADIGIIGLPNAGKSTLISRLSSAKPKVAEYPFTTLTPNLGVVSLLGEAKSCVIADIPGLLPGAHKGVGLGLQFLRHIERTKGFIHLIDGSYFNEKEPVQAFTEINQELKCYKHNYGKPLHEREQIVVINKADVIDGLEQEKIRSEFLKLNYNPIFISAVSGMGLKPLLSSIEKMVSKE